jgi:hypothetical protein
MSYASTFLSHSSSDKPLVDAVAHQLGRYGVVSWLDIRELRAGQALGRTLAEAIEELTTVTVFLSEKSVISPWVEDELVLALEKIDETGKDEMIIPVYLGDPLSLVTSHEQLSSRWLHRDGDRVDRLGIVPKGRTIAEKADDIARQVAQSIYRQLKFSESREIVLVLDQRGDGDRYGQPPLPANADVDKLPALVFRPDAGARTQGEVLSGDNWHSLLSDLRFGLSQSLGITQTPELRKIYIYGTAQLSLAYLLGHHFNRNTRTELYCHNSQNGSKFSNKGQARYTPLENGNPHCQTAHPDIPSIADAGRLNAVALLLSTERYISDVQDYLSTQPDAPPLVWVQSGQFNSSDDAMSYIADVVALLTRLKDQHRVRKVFLYCGLPFALVPLLAANLLNVMDNIVFMEYRRDLQGTDARPEDLYIPLPMIN